MEVAISTLRAELSGWIERARAGEEPGCGPAGRFRIGWAGNVTDRHDHRALREQRLPQARDRRDGTDLAAAMWDGRDAELSVLLQETSGWCAGPPRSKFNLAIADFIQ